ncbi:hypothetical protein DL96DRAFT_1788622 [Flagelloscypha sp. PMI_526]|nr:hypothetical protein DL96DRAFT_1788622 [Flagelloscypha sp. PMI_526]
MFLTGRSRGMNNYSYGIHPTAFYPSGHPPIGLNNIGGSYMAGVGETNTLQGRYSHGQSDGYTNPPGTCDHCWSYGHHLMECATFGEQMRSGLIANGSNGTLVFDEHGSPRNLPRRRWQSDADAVLVWYEELDNRLLDRQAREYAESRGTQTGIVHLVQQCNRLEDQLAKMRNMQALQLESPEMTLSKDKSKDNGYESDSSEEAYLESTYVSDCDEMDGPWEGMTEMQIRLFEKVKETNARRNALKDLNVSPPAACEDCIDTSTVPTDDRGPIECEILQENTIYFEEPVQKAQDLDSEYLVELFMDQIPLVLNCEITYKCYKFVPTIGMLLLGALTSALTLFRRVNSVNLKPVNIRLERIVPKLQKWVLCRLRRKKYARQT